MSKTTAEEDSERVLVVGGSLVGLSAAMFLASRGVPTVVVEKHPGSSPLPRAIGFTTRTLEMFRGVGIGQDLPVLPVGQGRPRRVAVESLAGRWAAEAEWSPGPARSAGSDAPPPPEIGYSPVTGTAIAQDRLEPVIRDRAIELGADIRWNTELTSFEQDADGVTASLRERDGREYTMRASYMIAADGHSSPVREALGVRRSGHGFMRSVRSIMFRASLDEYLESGISQFELDRPDLKGLLTTYRDGRWLLMVSDDQERSAAAQREIVIRAIGRSDLEVEIITSGRWVLAALIADRFDAGRVFLAGDAAHTLPPARGGYGANTGIEDSFNLAWKLASVLSGESTPRLLSTYHAERHPIAWLRHDQIFARPDYASDATEDEKKVAVIEDDAMELGQLYRSEAVLGAGDELPSALRPDRWAGQPGTRVPHRWVSIGGERRSTLDLLQRGWVLLSEEGRWGAAATRAGEQLGIELRYLRVGGDLTVPAPPIEATSLTADTPIAQIVADPAGKAALDTNIPELTRHEMYGTFTSMTLRQLQPISRGLITDEGLARTQAALAAVEVQLVPADPEAFRDDFRKAFGIGPTGASLIRPDGYVAWRSRELPDDPEGALVDALDRVSSAAHRSRVGAR